jgi:hypothetical protein
MSGTGSDYDGRVNLYVRGAPDDADPEEALTGWELRALPENYPTAL